MSEPPYEGTIHFPRCKPRTIFNVRPHIIRPWCPPVQDFGDTAVWQRPRLGEWSVTCRAWARHLRRLAPKTVFRKHPPLVSIEWLTDDGQRSGEGYVCSVLEYLPDLRFVTIEFQGTRELARTPHAAAS